jgi:hypothetical protein
LLGGVFVNLGQRRDLLLGDVVAGHTLLTRIARARAALAMLEGGLECPHDDIMTCPHFQGLLADRLQPPSVTGSDGRNAGRAIELTDVNDEGAARLSLRS